MLDFILLVPSLAAKEVKPMPAGSGQSAATPGVGVGAVESLVGHREEL